LSIRIDIKGRNVCKFFLGKLYGSFRLIFFWLRGWQSQVKCAGRNVFARETQDLPRWMGDPVG
jgi:hypothetical protein